MDLDNVMGLGDSIAWAIMSHLETLNLCQGHQARICNHAPSPACEAIQQGKEREVALPVGRVQESAADGNQGARKREAVPRRSRTL